MTALLELRGVHVHGPRGDRLKNIDLKIFAGERIALLGSNGAGKTSLLAVANGSLIPDVGEVLWRGCSIARARQRERKEIGTLWQDLRLIEEINVAQNINSGALGSRSMIWALANLFKPVEINTCSECLKAVGLPTNLLSAPVSELSGGQRQRVALARLLRQEPDLILADEPLFSLDPILAKEVLKLLLGITITSSIAIPRTLLMSMHQPHLIHHFDRVIGLRSGRLVCDQPTGCLEEGATGRIYGSA